MCVYTKLWELRPVFHCGGRRGARRAHSSAGETGLVSRTKRDLGKKQGIPILSSSLNPTSLKSRLAIQAWAKREMASSELLRSEVPSSGSWVGRAWAMCSKMEPELRGLDMMV